MKTTLMTLFALCFAAFIPTTAFADSASSYATEGLVAKCNDPVTGSDGSDPDRWNPSVLSYEETPDFDEFHRSFTSPLAYEEAPDFDEFHLWSDPDIFVPYKTVWELGSIALSLPPAPLRYSEYPVTGDIDELGLIIIIWI